MSSPASSWTWSWRKAGRSIITWLLFSGVAAASLSVAGTPLDAALAAAAVPGLGGVLSGGTVPNHDTLPGAVTYSCIATSSNTSPTARPSTRRGCPSCSHPGRCWTRTNDDQQRPRTIYGYSLAQVFGPTTPSAASPRLVWNALTTFSVRSPKTPSVTSGFPPRAP